MSGCGSEEGQAPGPQTQTMAHHSLFPPQSSLHHEGPQKHKVDNPAHTAMPCPSMVPANSHLLAIPQVPIYQGFGLLSGRKIVTGSYHKSLNFLELIAGNAKI